MHFVYISLVWQLYVIVTRMWRSSKIMFCLCRLLQVLFLQTKMWFPCVVVKLMVLVSRSWDLVLHIVRHWILWMARSEPVYSDNILKTFPLYNNLSATWKLNFRTFCLNTLYICWIKRKVLCNGRTPVKISLVSKIIQKYNSECLGSLCLFCHRSWAVAIR